MSLTKLADDTHHSEVTRRTELTNALTFPTGLLTVLLGVIGTMLSIIIPPLDSFERALIVICFLSAAPVIFSAYYLIRARIAHVYDYPANIRDIRVWHDSIVNSQYSVKEADAQLKSFLFEEYVKCASKNAQNNDARSAQIFRANQGLVVLIAMVALAGIPFLAIKIDRAGLPDTLAKSTLVNETNNGSCNYAGRNSASQASRGSPAGPAAAPHETHSRKHRAAKNQVSALAHEAVPASCAN